MSALLLWLYLYLISDVSTLDLLLFHLSVCAITKELTAAVVTVLQEHGSGIEGVVNPRRLPNDRRIHDETT